MRLLLATANHYKEEEFRAILQLLHCELRLERVEGRGTLECGVTYYQNAYRKAVLARSVASVEDVCNNVIFADDSGIEVPELSGTPGVRSARFEYQGYHERTALARQLFDWGISMTPARFVCWIVAFIPYTPVCFACSGAVDGTVVAHPRGLGGFGYDPMFIPQGYGLTFSEMEPDVKNGISHRAQAMKALWSRLQEDMSLRP